MSSFLPRSHRRARNQRGFSMIEMMIVVVIVAVLAAVAFVAFRRHLRKGYVVEATEFVTRIVAQQELLKGQTGSYQDIASATAYPALQANEPVEKAWTGIPAGWQALGLQPEKGTSYFGYVVRASTPTAHAFSGHASNARFGIPPQPTLAATDPGYIAPHPWFYVIAVGDMDGDAAAACNSPDPSSVSLCTMIVASSARPSPRVFNQNE
jgi:type IV pilus assembly protein PilA